MFARSLFALALAAPLLGTIEPPQVGIAVPPKHVWAQACDDWDEWEKPGPPFRIFGNTYYVGTCGIASILITTDDGHALIDSGTEAGADIVLANIRALGFDPKDVKVLLASHEHFDHVGGMAKLQRETGATVIASEAAVGVMLSGQTDPDDPQYGTLEPMEPIAEGMPYFWGDAPYRIDYFGIRPIDTPGHTSGAMSWSWEACEEDDCLTVVYADSLSAVSSDSYRFSDHKDYLGKFLKSFDSIAEARCDVLLTPHPTGGNLNLTMSLLERRKLDGMPDFACRGYAQKQKQALSLRLAKEAAAK